MMTCLTTVSNSIDATFLQHALEKEGIRSFTTNENTSALLPHFYGLMGHGIQIMVKEEDYKRANDILLKRQREDQTRPCPHCGSTNVGFGMKGKQRLGDKLLVFLSLVLTIPMGNLKNKFYCKECNSAFE